MPNERNNFVSDGFLEFVYILDKTYITKFIIDTFIDFLWTERYYGYGEFEITIPFNKDIYNSCKRGDYITIKESKKLMMVKTIGSHTDPENGDTITISGRSFESILERRIILDEMIGRIHDDGEAEKIAIQTAMKIMIENNVSNPSDQARKIPNFVFIESEDPDVLSIKIDSFSERGANLYDKVSNICKDKKIGFRIDGRGEGGFEFELYFGVDRSRDQYKRSVVVFSESYENLTNSDYIETDSDYKSVAYVEWDWTYDEDVTYMDSDGDSLTITETRTGTEITKSYRNNESFGLDRYETYMRNSEQVEVGSAAGIKNGREQMVKKGREYLADYETTQFFDGEVNPYRQFVYGIDYYLGDIIQLENKHGRTGRCRITEVVFARDASGPTMTPTFELVEDE